MLLNVEVKEPVNCSDAELSVFRDLVILGDEVTPNNLENRIRNAKLLAFGYSDTTPVGVGALKCQASNYRQMVFQKACIAELATEYVYELGWIYVSPPQRGNGYSYTLVKKLLNAFGSKSIYSTSKTTNKPMHKTLAKFGFLKVGNPWRSPRGPYDLEIYLRPATQPSAAADAPKVTRR